MNQSLGGCVGGARGRSAGQARCCQSRRSSTRASFKWRCSGAVACLTRGSPPRRSPTRATAPDRRPRPPPAPTMSPSLQKQVRETLATAPGPPPGSVGASPALSQQRRSPAKFWNRGLQRRRVFDAFWIPLSIILSSIHFRHCQWKFRLVYKNLFQLFCFISIHNLNTLDNNFF